MDELDDNDIIDYHDDGDSDYTLDTADSEEQCLKKFHPKVRIITEKAPTRAFYWLKATNKAFTFKTQLIHYDKWTLTLSYGKQK